MATIEITVNIEDLIEGDEIVAYTATVDFIPQTVATSALVQNVYFYPASPSGAANVYTDRCVLALRRGAQVTIRRQVEDAPTEPARPVGGISRRLAGARTRWITAVQAATAAAYTALHGFVATLFRNAARVLADYSRDQINKAAELIEDRAIHQLRPGIYLAVSEDGSQIHRTAITGQCTCKAGLKTTTAGRGCYHVAAARALEVT